VISSCLETSLPPSVGRFVAMSTLNSPPRSLAPTVPLKSLKRQKSACRLSRPLSL
jgi:hypothetical protein